MNKSILLCGITLLAFGLSTISSLAQPGALDLSFDPGAGANDAILTVAIQDDGKILIGGDFTTFDGTARNRIARLNSDGSLDTGFDPGSGANGRVRDVLALSDGGVLIGGAFSDYDGSAVGYIAKLNPDGSLDQTFASGTGFNLPVNVMVELSDGRLLLGGEFTSYDGVQRIRLARLMADGTADASFTGTANPTDLSYGHVSTLAVLPNGKIMVGGEFSNLSGTQAGRIGRLTADGGNDNEVTPFPGGVLFETLTSALNRPPYSINVQPNGQLIMGGNFMTVGYQSTARKKILRMQANGGNDPGFAVNPGFQWQGSDNASYVQKTLLEPDGKVLVGGNFDNYNGTSVLHLVRLTSSGALDASFDPGTGPDEAIWDMAYQTDGRVVIVGYLQSYDGIPRARIARILNCETPQPSAILGNGVAQCPGAEEFFAVDSLADATGYIWNLPDGWEGSSTDTFIVATVNGWGGTVSVQAITEECGISPARELTVADRDVPEVPICLVTVDSTSQYNIVAWQKPETTAIDSFFVYREEGPDFQKIGVVPYDSLSLYRDFNADPNVTSYRYKLSVLDTCGVEWQQSLAHNTIHFQHLGNGNFQWTLYDIETEGNPVEFYRMYRDEFSNGNFLPINTALPGGNGTFTVTDFASFPNAAYVLDVTWDRSCTASRVDVTINTTRSNIELVLPTGLQDSDMAEFSLYPNPAQGSVTIALPVDVATINMTMHDALGREVYRQTLSGGQHTIALDGLQSGVYAVRMGSGVRRLVVH